MSIDADKYFHHAGKAKIDGLNLADITNFDVVISCLSELIKADRIHERYDIEHLIIKHCHISNTNVVHISNVTDVSDHLKSMTLSKVQLD